MLTDLRFAFRQFAKAPGLAVTIVLTLALSIGACTAIYSALDAMVLNPFDDPATKRNVLLRSLKLPHGVEGGLSYRDFLELRTQVTSFESMVHFTFGEANLIGPTEPHGLRRYITTAGYFEILGIKMALGRTFLPEEHVPGNGNVVILSHGTWQRVFAGSPDILGRTVQLDDQQCTVVGVTWKNFERSSAGFPGLWLPLPTDHPSNPQGRGSHSYGRLRQGVTIAQAQSELDVIAAALAQKYPATNKNSGFIAKPELDGVQFLKPTLKMLFAAVGCLMLIACVNVASLLLIRANERQREMSIRAALGATRGRVIRQLLTENVLVALIGGATGVILAQWALAFVAGSVPQGAQIVLATGGSGFARLAYLTLNPGVLAFALGLSVATALVFGLAPAWLSSSADLNEALKQGTRGSTEGRSRARFRSTLVVIEIAMAVTLLACSGLFIRSFLKESAYQPGFNPKRAAFVRLALRGKNYESAEQRFAFVNSLLAGIQRAGGVEAAGSSNSFPLMGRKTQAAFEIEGGSAIAPTERPLAQLFAVSPDYFSAMGIPLKQGRYLSERDSTSSRRVAVINQTFAQQHFPQQNPIGRRITIANPSDRQYEVVGIVGDVAQEAIGEIPSPQLYESHAQMGNLVVIVVRGQGDPALLPAIIQKEVRALDPDLPVTDPTTVDSFLRDKLSLRRLTIQLLAAFSGIGVIIAAIGIYGVMAFSVSQRTVEIGIRMALGAEQQDVLRLVLRQSAVVVGIGLVLGIIGTLIAGRALESQLYNTSGSDPLILAGITLFFAAVATLACWFPARRATRVNPIVALRAE